MYENWEIDAIRKEDEYAAGWEYLQAALAEDEAWAQFLYESYHGQEV